MVQVKCIFSDIHTYVRQVNISDVSDAEPNSSGGNKKISSVNFAISAPNNSTKHDCHDEFKLNHSDGLVYKSKV